MIQSYELAFRMQGKVPELLDISREPQAVLDAYGVKPGPAGSFARQCLMARRLSEAGVRFVEICQPGWDHHTNLHKGLISNCRMTDQPTAALLADLEQRGLLDETLVLFGSEFGRQPTAQGPDGRDHNITGYPMWLAGAGVKKGFSYGATDEYGIHAVEGRMHTNDLHATLLALMGLDHEKLTYRYAGRDFRLTDVAGNVVSGDLCLKAVAAGARLSQLADRLYAGASWSSCRTLDTVRPSSCRRVRRVLRESPRISAARAWCPPTDASTCSSRTRSTAA